jgi:hypothetical protein
VNEQEIDAQTLAALMDGRLADPLRADLLARLAASPEALEVQADAAAVLGELEPDSGKVLPLPAPASGLRRRLPIGLAAAAVIAAISLGGPLIQEARWSSPPGSARFLAPLLENGAVLPADFDLRPWTAVRGGGPEPLTPAARAARAGALGVDLEIAVWSRDTTAPRLANELAVLLGGVPAGAPVATMYRVIAQRAGAAPKEILPLLDRAAAAARELTAPDLYQLGAWGEAARIAAARRDVEFFRVRESRRALDWAARLPTLPDAARPAVERLQSRLQSPKAPDWAALNRDVAELLRVLGS